MARHYYLTRPGRLRRKDNTLCFELIEKEESEAQELKEENIELLQTPPQIDQELTDDGMGDLSIELNQEDSEFDPQAPVKVKERRIIPIEDVDTIWAFSHLSINSNALLFLARHKVPLHLFNYYGFYSGTFYPREYLQAGYLLVRQVQHYSNRRLRVVIAKEIIRAALHNILKNLRYYENRGIEIKQYTESVQTEIIKLEEFDFIEGIMSCEGRARAAYYQAFPYILKDNFEFTKRVRQPPNNIINTLISFTNSLVYSTVLTQLYRTQLDPTISFLHEPGYRRFCLALDIAEIFKPILADRLIFKILNNRQLSERDFAKDLNFCFLKESGRKVILEDWSNRLQTTIEHRRLRRKVSYERLIRLECYKLVKHLTNIEPYIGFRAWW
jgi:CRISP-associated protein Cas1